MEHELERKIFHFMDYRDNTKFKEIVKKYMDELKEKYPGAIVLKEFYMENDILVRCIKVEERKNEQNSIEFQREQGGKELYKEERNTIGGGQGRER